MSAERIPYEPPTIRVVRVEEMTGEQRAAAQEILHKQKQNEKLASEAEQLVCPSCRRIIPTYLDTDKTRCFNPHGDRGLGGPQCQWAGKPTTWMASDASGLPFKSQANIRVALGLLGVRLMHDTFANRLRAERGGRRADVDDALIERLWLESDQRYLLRPPLSFFSTVLRDLARTNAYHPIRDYLNSLAWDTVKRIDQWLVTNGKADDTEYVRAVAALVLIAAVRRVRQPGCKFDELLILESGQGLDKSSALRALCPQPEWFSDSLPLGADAKLTIEGTAGVWIAEASDLQGRGKRDLDALKAALSRQEDGPVRLAYAHEPVTVPRQFVVIGTTNRNEYLLDSTGNRRFWPVKVGRFDLDGLKRDRDQLWAEAALREATDEPIRLRRDLWPVAAHAQEARRVEDPWEEVLAARLGDANGKVFGEDVWSVLSMTPDRRKQEDNERLGAVMRRLGFERKNLRQGKRVGKGYERGKSGAWLVTPGIGPEGEL